MRTMLRTLFNLIVILALTVGIVLLAWYRVDGQPLPETADYVRATSYVVTEERDGTLLFRPKVANGFGLLIMHGALIKPRSYARTAAWFTQRGYTVLLPSGDLRLSINAIDDAAQRMADLALERWFVIGHSMGGYASLSLIERHAPNVAALALWAAAPPTDFSSLELPTLFIWGDNDGLLPESRFAAARSLLPPETRYLTLKDANHRDFALYSHQFFDNESILGADAQINFANQQTAEFFAEHFAPIDELDGDESEE